MFYQYSNGALREVAADRLQPQTMTVGYVDVQALDAVRAQFGFAESTVASCRTASRWFRSGVEVYADYTFTQLRIFNSDPTAEDCVALYLKKDLLLVVDVEDADGSTKDKFLSVLNRYPVLASTEKLLYAFLEVLVAGDIQMLEEVGAQLSEKEEQILLEQTDGEFNASLFRLKNRITRRYNYYEQILDITDAVCENENGIFSEDELLCVGNITRKVERLKEDTADLRSMAEHLQEAYSSALDIKMNHTMKVFTLLTGIFFPLTIIVGWYGMNFQMMPELGWRFGYVYVIALSALTVFLLVRFGKKKKWF